MQNTKWTHRLKKIVHHALPLCLLCLALPIFPPRAHAHNIAEFTFDDGDDGTGPHDGQGELNNMATNFSALGSASAAARLTTGARRSALNEGRYGRGADLQQGGAIEVTGWVPMEAVSTVYLWARARSTASGHFLHIDQTLAIALQDGQLVAQGSDSTGDMISTATGVAWPSDGDYHHLAISLDPTAAPPEITLYIDGQQVVTLDIAVVNPPSQPSVHIGDGFDGLIDELWIKKGTPGFEELWDSSPQVCPVGTTCLEEVLTLTPTGFTHQVPVRFKSVYDPAQCSAQSPCPLLIDISGGGNCANDYASRSELRTFANQGFFAVTIDPYCEASSTFMTFPMETSQIVAVKNHMLGTSPLRDLIAGPDYFATGCSHGCQTVMTLMMHETDHPARTYGRSCNPSWYLCGYEADVFCPATRTFLTQQIIGLIGSLDFEDPKAQQHYNLSVISKLSAQTAANREVALSWGVNLEGPVCNDDGYPVCFEEGMWAMTYGSRRFRDMWQLLQPADGPTGYFVEDHNSDCKHCASLNSEAFACGACLLKHGRAQMAVACPECLTYNAPTIEPGASAQICPVEASWYTDPLQSQPPVDAGGTVDADVAADAAVPGNDATVAPADAAMVHPDAAVATPDAAVATPDAAATESDAAMASPDTAEPLPDASVADSAEPLPDAAVADSAGPLPDASVADSAEPLPDAAVADGWQALPDVGTDLSSGQGATKDIPVDQGCTCSTANTAGDGVMVWWMIVLLGIYRCGRRL